MVGQKQQAVEKALALFWAHGVADTSYGALVRETGLSRKALYARWPDKSALVHETVLLYRQKMQAMVADSLSPPGIKALRRFWQNMETSMRQPGWSGCYLFRLAAGEGRHDAAVIEVFNAYIALLHGKLEQAMVAAKQAGDLPDNHNTQAASRQVVALLGMASVLGGQSGFSPDVAALIAIGRDVCGCS